MSTNALSKSVFFFQQISNILGQSEIIFGNMMNIGLEESTNLWKYDFYHTLLGWV